AARTAWTPSRNSNTSPPVASPAVGSANDERSLSHARSIPRNPASSRYAWRRSVRSGPTNPGGGSGAATGAGGPTGHSWGSLTCGDAGAGEGGSTSRIGSASAAGSDDSPFATAIGRSAPRVGGGPSAAL